MTEDVDDASPFPARYYTGAHENFTIGETGRAVSINYGSSGPDRGFLAVALR